MPECTSIESHPEETDTLILTFDQRYQAETVSRALSYLGAHMTYLALYLPFRPVLTLHSSSMPRAQFPTPALSTSHGSPTTHSAASLPLLRRRTPMPTVVLTMKQATASHRTRSRMTIRRWSRNLRKTHTRRIRIWMSRTMWISGCRYGHDSVEKD
jgi:hypothetical protein